MASRKEKELGRGNENFQEGAFEVPRDKQKRTVYDQFSEEVLKGGRGPSPGAETGGGSSGFIGSPGVGGPPFAFTTSEPEGNYTGPNISDLDEIFESILGGASPLFRIGGLGAWAGWLAAHVEVELVACLVHHDKVTPTAAP
ncbi:hypothetical protein H1R20_g1371, partial [Candolleomyces eurysporus]